MDEVGKDDGDRDDGMGKAGFFDEAPFVDDRRRGFGERKREKVPDQKPVEEEEIIVFDRLLKKKGKDKSNDEHLEKRVGNEPKKPKDRVFVPRPELLFRHGKKKIDKQSRISHGGSIILRVLRLWSPEAAGGSLCPLFGGLEAGEIFRFGFAFDEENFG